MAAAAGLPVDELFAQCAADALRSRSGGMGMNVSLLEAAGDQVMPRGMVARYGS